MENYTKYRLKNPEELAQALSGLDNLFVVSCNKCFGEYELHQEPALEEFLRLAEEQGKTVTGTAQLDFLCNKTRTAKALAV